MKTMYLFLIVLCCTAYINIATTEPAIDPNILLGEWTLDMTPLDLTDDNFAMMRITKIKDNSFQGEFYRKGVKIKNAQLNTQGGMLYGALISGDNSGAYNTTFQFREGKLFGTTHAVDKQFLSVWTATKKNQ